MGSASNKEEFTIINLDEEDYDYIKSIKPAYFLKARSNPNKFPVKAIENKTSSEDFHITNHHGLLSKFLRKIEHYFK